MDNQIFRSKSLEQISSPEQLNDYLRVTNPSVWLVLIAIILLLAGVLVWSTAANINSYATGTAQVTNGNMVVVFDDDKAASKVKPGMEIELGDARAKVSSVGTDADGHLFASADTTLADGAYTARVLYRTTQVLELLFN